MSPRLRHIFVIIGAMQAAIPATITLLQMILAREDDIAILINIIMNTLNQLLHLSVFLSG